jgi:hypothetical protein
VGTAQPWRRVLALDSDALMQHTVSMYIRTNQPSGQLERDLTRPGPPCGVLSRQPRQRPTSHSTVTRPRKLLLRLRPPAERLTSRVCLEQLHCSSTAAEQSTTDPSKLGASAARLRQLPSSTRQRASRVLPSAAAAPAAALL